MNFLILPIAWLSDQAHFWRNCLITAAFFGCLTAMDVWHRCFELAYPQQPLFPQIYVVVLLNVGFTALQTVGVFGVTGAVKWWFIWKKKRA